MNNEFITKMIAAKKLECEALRELLPEKVREDMDEIRDYFKGFLMEAVREFCFSQETSAKSSDKKKSGEDEIRKINID